MSELSRPDDPTDLDADGGADPVDGDLFLLVRQGDEARIVELREGQTLLVGRAEEAEIALPFGKVSRRHAEIHRASDRVTVRDLGSRNGTKVGSRGVGRDPVYLQPGDVVRLGTAEIVLARAAPAEAPSIGPTDDVVLADPSMVKTFTVAARLARAPSTVLIVGETGAGKEVVAERIHTQSERAGQAFVRVNCGALPESLVESELFGHERGAFTGAQQRKIGLLEAADGGTLFLDEIGELSAGAQVKLLRFLETKKLMRVGGTEEIDVDVRVLCATHRDLPTQIESGAFRQDLYYRISTFTLRVPPLRERPSEILLLTSLFCRRFAERLGRAAPTVSEATRQVLQKYSFPGNVRELRNALEHAMVLADAVIEPEHLPAVMRSPTSGAIAPSASVPPSDVKAAVQEVERDAIEAALRAHGGNQTHAAKALGLSRRAFIYKMNKYGLR